MQTTEITDKQRIIEIVAVIITGIGKLVFMDLLQMKLPYIITIIVGWVSYIIYKSITSKGLLKYWGFRTDNIRETLNYVLPFSILSIIFCCGYGYYKETINFTWHIIPILILYPTWGIIQQFLVIGLIAGNLKNLNTITISTSIIIVFTALIFSVIHFPSPLLMISTFILALFYGWVHLKHKNFYVLGIIHGFLGALFFYTIENRDPFLEVLGFLCK